MRFRNDRRFYLNAFVLRACFIALGALVFVSSLSVAVPAQDGSADAVSCLSRDAAKRADARSVLIPKDLDKVPADLLLDFVSVERYEVEEGNGAYCSVDGVLYAKDKKTLVKVPAKYPDKELSVPEGVYFLGARSFLGCGTLETIALPASVKRIDDDAFGYCSSLKEIKVADGSSSYKTIDGALFSKDGKVLVCHPAMSSVKAYEVPEGVEEIAGGAFANSSSLESVVLPDSVKLIGNSGFAACERLKSVRLGAGVGEIGPTAFAGCLALESIELPKSVWNLGVCAFINCPALKRIDVEKGNAYLKSVDGIVLTKDGKTFACFPGGIELKEYAVPKGVAAIFPGAFSCSRVETVVLPEGVRVIAQAAFDHCSALKSVDLPKSLEGIGAGAFRRCSSLETIRLPERLQALGDSAFEKCESLKAIKIPARVKSIPLGAFRNCPALETVVFSKGLTSIEDRAFEGCSSLKEIVFPDSLRTIGKNAFADCSALTSVVAPDALTEIDETAFRNCLLLTDVPKGKSRTKQTAPSSGPVAKSEKKTQSAENDKNAQSAGTDRSAQIAKSGQKPERIVVIPKEVAEIGAQFNKLTNDKLAERFEVEPGNPSYAAVDGILYSKDLKSLMRVPEQYNESNLAVPEHVTYLDAFAFGNCERLNTIVIPESVDEISSIAFVACRRLKSIEVVEGNKSYKTVDGALLTKDGKTLVCVPAGIKQDAYVVPNGVETIEDAAFVCCASIKSLVLPEGVKRINGNAFLYSSFQQITLPASLKEVSVDAFSSFDVKPIIRAPKGSSGEAIAKRNKLRFEPL
ncbi:MAG: leucine-rich repeat domain-containing protein [Thermoguttaceae bacterium]|nr:leucine-rich repeat domain-containing protein [Thermoguttaceae bacterium]